MADRLPISVAIVCKDSSRTIERVLASVGDWVGEIVAVDSGSTDGTIETLERFGARVIRSEWLGHVKTKQKALEACTQAWALCLDSDEIVEPDLRASIVEMVRQDDLEVAGAMVNRKIWYCGRFLNHAWQAEWRLRLIRLKPDPSSNSISAVPEGSPMYVWLASGGYLARWGGHDPHDKLELEEDFLIGYRVNAGVPAAVEKLAGTLRHESFETFAEQFAKDSGYARLMATNLHAAGVRGSRLRCVTSPIGAFAKQMVVKQAWRDGRAGWLAALATANATLQKHAILLELSMKDQSGG